MKRVTLWFINLYQLIISPYWPGSCRHVPTCSNYTRQAVQKYGVLKGGVLAWKRLARCLPLGTVGYDPVP